MTTSQPSLLQLAKQGDPAAIADLMNQSLPKGTTAKVSLKEGCLKVMLESVEVPERKVCTEFIHRGITGLNSASIRQVKVYGRETGEDFPSWQEAFEITVPDALDTVELAKQGNLEAIATLCNQWLGSSSITSKVTLKDTCLRVMLEATEFPDQPALVAQILENVQRLGIQNCSQLKIGGRAPGDEFPDWQQTFDLNQPSEFLAMNGPQIPAEVETKQGNFWGAIFGAVSGAAGAVGEAATYAGGTVVGTVSGAAGAMGEAATYAGGAVTGAIAGTAGAVGGAAAYAGNAVVGTVTGVAGAVGNTAMQATDGVGYVLHMISDSPQLQELTKTIQVDKFIYLIDKVDIVKAETQVKKLQRKYPNEKPGEIAHRVMMEKALYVGGSGFASSVVPGFAAAMFAVDLAATMALQAEMVYQIACAYGLDLHDPARKGEVLAIFGMALGGNFALKAGLGLARNIPFAGAVIGASGNAAMLYVLGYAACQFYEAKFNPFAATDPASSQAASDEYLREAIKQQVIMDQILVHLLLAGNPGKTLLQMLPELQSLNLSPAALETIAANPKALPPLDKLLEQLNRDFAVSLVAQCHKIAEADGVITPKESRVIKMVTQKLNTIS